MPEGKKCKAEAVITPDGELIVAVSCDVEDAHTEVKAARVSVADWKGSTSCKLDLWPYANYKKT